VAFVGPNGAGKSTTIKMLSGILHPTMGLARVAGFVPWIERRRLAYRIGTVFGQRSQLWYHLPAADTFELLARMYDQEPAQFGRRRDALVDAFGIGEHLHKPVRELSLGQRMRCEIVASLLHAPEIVFLDEPTIGLDVSAKATIRDVVRELSVRDGCTVLLTSHDTGDMESVCDRVIVIHRGRMLLDQSIDTLRQRFIRRKLVTLLTAEPTVIIDLPGVVVIASRPHRTELEVDLDLTPVEAVVSAAIRTTTLRDLTVADPPMDAVVQAIYREAES
jgi:ABC-2 type transport system ATP-binding protein